MKNHCDQKGFTLIEVMIALVITGIVIGAAIVAFFKLQSTSSDVDQRSTMATTSRGAMYMIEDNIRLLGFNPQKNISPNDIIQTATGALLTFTRNDLTQPGVAGTDDTVSIGLYDFNAGAWSSDGIAVNDNTSLCIDDNGAVTADEDAVADDVERIRFAYAYDIDDDGNVELSANNHIVWAIDSNNDGFLETQLDTDDDGDIDLGDAAGGVALGSQVAISKIRAVKVWLVVRSSDPVRGTTERHTMVVGDQRYAPNDKYSHTLFTTTIRCRNKS